ncbi:wd repeat-containing protein 89 [Lichtheimia corymbifera JMRC:FSU:9682]|uniref:Wd repeat-containing protein 89 n=1 Tax=Lichtheimia corymbifera JMRC:FSU:9682 TaxID=1263082 RepID=A0A068RT19_9FUNG|nr:wd repeat-containing protein 89 [Lichtheimia corymbifera JMRC:FSU:9682]
MIQVESNPTLLPPFQPVQALDLQLGNEYVLQVTANSQYAMASCSDSTVRLYDLATLQPATALRQQKVLTKMQLYNDSTLFTSSVDGTLVRWDLRTAQPVQTLTYSKPISAFDINCNDTMAVVGTSDYDKYANGELVFFDTRQSSILHKFVESHLDDITEIQCHPSMPARLLSSSTDGIINYYDVTDFDEEEDILAVVDAGSSIQRMGFFGPDAEYVYSLTHTETFLLHTLEGDLICDFGDVRSFDSNQVEYAIDCSYDPVSQRFYLITGNNSGDVQLLHVNVGQVQHCQTLKAPGGHTDIVRAVYWNHHSQSILTGGEDGRMCAWQGASSS